LKSFRDRTVEFGVYDRSTFDDTFLRSLGPLEKHRRPGDEGAPIGAAGQAPHHAETTARSTMADRRVRSN